MLPRLTTATRVEGFQDPRKGEQWVRNPNGKGHGWLDSKGHVWVPTGPGDLAHGGPHWDVQNPRKPDDYRNMYPGGGTQAMSNSAVLEAKDIVYFSPLDEKMFFASLNAIGAVTDVKGRGRAVLVTICRDRMSESDLRDLLGLFRRYKLNRAQFIAFDCEEFAVWFRNPKASWYREVFESKGS